MDVNVNNNYATFCPSRRVPDVSFRAVQVCFVCWSVCENIYRSERLRSRFKASKVSRHIQEVQHKWFTLIEQPWIKERKWCTYLTYEIWTVTILDSWITIFQSFIVCNFSLITLAIKNGIAIGELRERRNDRCLISLRLRVIYVTHFSLFGHSSF